MFNLDFPILLDGATGTNLLNFNEPNLVCLEKFILDNPQKLIDLHLQFKNSNSKIILSPTLTSNRIFLKKFGLDNNVIEINQKLVEISKKSGLIIGGDISSLNSWDKLTFNELIEIYDEQISGLIKGLCDFLMIETMISYIELKAALISCKKYNLPIIVSMASLNINKTLDNYSYLDCLKLCENFNVISFGFNCGSNNKTFLKNLNLIKNFINLPLFVKPSLELPNKDGIYDDNNFPKFIKKLLKLDIKLIGGCCGTNFNHIKIISNIINN